LGGYWRTSFAGHSQKELDAIAAKLNGRPRQTLNWMTPSQKLAEVLRWPCEAAVAIERNFCPAESPAKISSRSASDNRSSALLRTGGRTPPVTARQPRTEACAWPSLRATIRTDWPSRVHARSVPSPPPMNEK
jgi:hypothetical protein